MNTNQESSTGVLMATEVRQEGVFIPKGGVIFFSGIILGIILGVIITMIFLNKVVKVMAKAIPLAGQTFNNQFRKEG